MNFAEFWAFAPFVAFGGAVGAITRWATFRAWGSGRVSSALLTVNLAGSFALGVFYALSPSVPWQATVTLVAFTGGLTTFSTLVVDIAMSLRSRLWWRALVSTVVHFGGGAVCALFGAGAVMLTIGA
ncbi:MAG: fluoride efflux transporter FluC [Microbacteriaceae bacterium]